MSDIERIAAIEDATKRYLEAIRQIRHDYHESIESILNDAKHKALKDTLTEIDNA